MARWPDVPAVFGWLGLDRRGRWLLRGEPIGNRTVNAFISRNYAADDRGRWYFQNGPQRVFVELAYTPWVFALDGAGRLRSHTGDEVSALAGAWVDDECNLLLAASQGPGVVDDRDLAALLARFADERGRTLGDEQVERAIGRLAGGDRAGLFMAWRGGLLPVTGIRARQVAARFGFEPSPRPDEAEPARAAASGSAATDGCG